MNRELFILFVYDTQLCQKEEDDPQDAILYFYPSWVTDQQRLALCGQLMGATQFFITAFSCPHILCLHSGKFAFQQCGQYIIAIGTDCNVPDRIIEYRASILHNVLQLYHQDLDTISRNCYLAGYNLKDKLRHIFDTFLPVLQYGIDIFGTVPTIQLPKSASNVFLEAIQILHCCQEKRGVLGGIVLYQNRVVATQLCPGLTKSLVFTDPYRIKSPADNVSTPFHLPLGVQLLTIYIDHKEYLKLSQEAKSSQSLFESVANRKKCQKNQTPGGKIMNTPKEHNMSSMKRDISRIFTVPEEKEGETEPLDDSDFGIVVINRSDVPSYDIATKVNTVVSPMCGNDTSLPPRVNDINFSKVLHEKVVSICRIPESDERNDVHNLIPKYKTEHVIPDVVKDAIKVQTQSRDLQKSNEVPNVLLSYPHSELNRCQSMTHIHQSPRISSNRVPMRCYSFGLPQVTRDLLGESSEESPDDTSKVRHFYNTITDPYFPVFRCDGLPISRSLFDEHLAQHYRLLNREKCVPTNFKPVKPETLDLHAIQSLSPCIPVEDAKKDPLENDPPTNIPECLQTTVSPPQSSAKQEIYRRSLSLPLKSLTSDCGDANDGRRKATSFTAGVLESPSVRTRTLGSLPLTPLMSKLSLLAQEEKSSGFCSRETTPSEPADYGFPTEEALPAVTLISRLERKAHKNKLENKSDFEMKTEENPEKTVLYVFGQLNMALLLLMEEEFSHDPELIHSLWETSVGSLGRLETHLNHCLEHTTQGGDADSYSYISLDPKWDMLQRGGAWGCLELDMVGSLHHDFSQTKNLTEVVVRCEDSTVYGYQCGKTEVFYQQSSSSTAGLPTPSDLMGIVPLKARRRLERDHGIVLL